MKRAMAVILAMVLVLWPDTEQALLAADNKKDTGAQHNLLYWYRNYDSKATYDILELALQKTEELYGGATIIRGPPITQGRAIVELQHDHHASIRLINVVADDTREQALMPIRIAVDEGLIGLRVCIINKDDRALFENVRSHQDITDRGITFGQGAHWPDTDILRANAFSVLTSARYENLIPMLKRKRFHCFLRGANEAISDFNQYEGNDLMIEPGLLFAYPSSSLFFVSKDDTRLAARIELGLRRAILDGSFSEYFHQTYSRDIAALNLKKRRVIRLNNPLLSDETLLKTSRRTILIDGKLGAY